MPDSRWPKMCYKRLRQLENNPCNKIKFNWTTQLKQTLSELNLGRIWEEQNPLLIKREIKNIIRKHEEITRIEDKNRIQLSSYNPRYKYIKSSQGIENYLTMKLNMDIVRVISQLRMMGTNFIRLIIKGYNYKWNPNITCMVCNLQKNEDLYHVLIICPIYDHIRKQFFKNFIDHKINENNYMTYICSELSENKIKNIYFLLINMVKIRSFMLME